MRHFLLLLLSTLLLLWACSDDIVGTTDETEIVGTILLSNGKAAQNAKIDLYEKGDLSSDAILSTMADENGNYRFSNIDYGSFTLYASLIINQDTLSAIVPQVDISEEQKQINLGNDTLHIGGYIHGQLLWTDSSYAQKVTAYIPGTSFLAITDSIGLFTISHVPAHTYRLSFLGSGIKDTLTDEFIVRLGDTTKLGTITLAKHDTLVYRNIYGTFPNNYEEIKTVTATVHGDNLGASDTFPQYLDWNPQLKGYNGKFHAPANVSNSTVTIKVYDAQERKIGQYSLSFSDLSGDILVPEFNPRNATPHITVEDKNNISNGSPITLTAVVIDSFGGTITSFGWDLDNDNLLDTTAESYFPITITPNKTGVTLINCSATDNNGNRNRKTVSLHVPDLAPEIEWISPRSDTLIWDTLTDVNFEVQTKDSFGGSVRQTLFTINGESSPESSVISRVESLKYGTNEIIVSATDNDNNTVHDTLYVRLESIASISAGDKTSFYVTHAQKLYATGFNYQGKLGIGDVYSRDSFHFVDSQVLAIHSGEWHTGFLKNNNRLYCFGDNSEGQLGNGTMGHSVYEVSPSYIRVNTQKFTAGKNFSYLLTLNGSLYVMGRNDIYGVFATDTTPGSATPHYIRNEIKDVSAGANHGLVVTTDGKLLTVGDNSRGQLGNGKSGYYEIEKSFQEILTDIVAVEAGAFYSMAIDNAGNLWAWGENRVGQLGNGESGNGLNVTTPVKVLTNVKEVSCGSQHTLILKNDNTLWVCGNNANGQLGTGDTKNIEIPIKVRDNVKAIAAGFSHSLIIDINGRLYGAGENRYGQLGENIVEDITNFSPLITF